MYSEDMRCAFDRTNGVADGPNTATWVVVAGENEVDALSGRVLEEDALTTQPSLIVALETVVVGMYENRRVAVLGTALAMEQGDPFVPIVDVSYNSGESPTIAVAMIASSLDIMVLFQSQSQFGEYAGVLS